MGISGDQARRKSDEVRAGRSRQYGCTGVPSYLPHTQRTTLAMAHIFSPGQGVRDREYRARRVPNEVGPEGTVVLEFLGSLPYPSQPEKNRAIARLAAPLQCFRHFATGHTTHGAQLAMQVAWMSAEWTQNGLSVIRSGYRTPVFRVACSTYWMKLYWMSAKDGPTRRFLARSSSLSLDLSLRPGSSDILPAASAHDRLCPSSTVTWLALA